MGIKYRVEYRTAIDDDYCLWSTYDDIATALSWVRHILRRVGDRHRREIQHEVKDVRITVT